MVLARALRLHQKANKTNILSYDLRGNAGEPRDFSCHG
jgi:hypothetical protein